MPDRRAVAKSYFAREYVKDAKNAPRRVLNNPERTEANLAALLRQRYKLSIEQFQQMRIRQHDVCAICGTAAAPDGKGPMGRLHVDHDHATDQVRALLCSNCNNGLGRFGDDPCRLRAAAAYLESFPRG